MLKLLAIFHLGCAAAIGGLGAGPGPAPVAFQLGATNLSAAFEANSIEGSHGDHDGRVIDLKTPVGVLRLKD